MATEKKPRHRPGVNSDGTPGVRVQVILSAEQLRALDAFRGNKGRGPAVRDLIQQELCYAGSEYVSAE